MREITVKVYKFSELSDEAKEKAREWYRECTSDDSFIWDNIQEDAKEIGLMLRSLSGYRANEGRFDKFAEDTAERILKNHGESCDTYKTAKAYLDGLKGLKRDEDGELSLYDQDKANELEKEFLHDLLEDYRTMLEKEIEYQNSDETVDENIEANEYEFTEDGKRKVSI